MQPGAGVASPGGQGARAAVERHNSNTKYHPIFLMREFRIWICPIQPGEHVERPCVGDLGGGIELTERLDIELSYPDFYRFVGFGTDTDLPAQRPTCLYSYWEAADWKREILKV
jgi:hypothetical protein